MISYRKNGKRMIDLAGSLLLLLICAPIFVFTSILILITSGRPIFFKQERLGLAGKRFTILKFRTMAEVSPDSQIPFDDENRLTKIGKFLRESSMDEIPQLLNVLKGEMSIVGPRPLIPRYFPYFRDSERIRFLVKPGITGLSQISGRNNLPWSERFELDQEYVRSMSFYLDLRIVFKTLLQVIRRADIHAVTSNSTILDLDVERKVTQIFNQAFKIEELKCSIPISLYGDLLEKLKEMHEELYPFMGFEGKYFRTLIDKLQNHLSKDSATLFIALRNKKLLGLCWCYKLDYLDEKRLHIAYLFVDRNHRKLGIASKLLEAASNKAREFECCALDLNVEVNNDTALEFYKRKGFVEDTVKLKVIVN